MTKLFLATDLRNQFAAAKASLDPKGAKAIAWSAIRSRYGIPSYVKLGFDDNFAVYDKKSNPRAYLQVSDTGRYTGTLADGAAPVKAPEQAQAVSAPKFAAADSSANDTAWHVVDRQQLLAVLREGVPSGQKIDTLPSGFPTTLCADAVVLDSTSGNLYFRA